MSDKPTADRPWWWRYHSPAPSPPDASIEGIERLLIALTQQVRTLGEILLTTTKGLQTQMAQLDDALTTIETAVQQVATDVSAEIDRMNALIAQGASPAEVQAAVARAQALVSTLTTLDAAAVAAGQPITPPPTPSP